MARLLKAINLLASSEVSSTSATYVKPANAPLWVYDPAQYDAVDGIYFEAVLSQMLSGAVYAALWDATAGSVVAESEVSTSTTAYVRRRSGDLSAVLVEGHEYHACIRRDNWSVRLWDARIIIAQAGEAISKTTTEIEIGNARGQTGTPYADVWTGFPWIGGFIWNADCWNGVQKVSLDVHIGIAGGDTGYFGLYDITSDEIVTGSITEFTGTTVARRVSADFGASLVDGHTYFFVTRTQSGTSSVSFGQARLVIEQANFTKTECYFTNSNSGSFSSDWTANVRFLADPDDWAGESIAHYLTTTLNAANTTGGPFAALRATGTSTDLVRVTSWTVGPVSLISDSFDPGTAKEMDIRVGRSAASGTHDYMGGHWLVRVTLPAGSAIIEGNGAVTAAPAALAAAGAEAFSGIGTVDTGPALVAAGGGLAFGGQGAFTAAPAVLAGLGTAGVPAASGVGTVVVASASLSALGGLGFGAAGDLVARGAGYAAAARLCFAGLSAPAVPGAQLESGASLGLVGGAAVATVSPGLTATARLRFAVLGNVTARWPSPSATGVLALCALGEAATLPAGLGGEAALTFAGMGSVAAALSRLAAVGAWEQAGQGALTVQMAAVTALGRLAYSGSGTTVGSMSSMTGAGALAVVAVSASAIPVAILTGAGALGFWGSGAVSALVVSLAVSSAVSFGGAGSLRVASTRSAGRACLAFAGPGSLRSVLALLQANGILACPGLGWLISPATALAGRGTVRGSEVRIIALKGTVGGMLQLLGVRRAIVLTGVLEDEERETGSVSRTQLPGRLTDTVRLVGRRRGRE